MLYYFGLTETIDLRFLTETCQSNGVKEVQQLMNTIIII